MAAPSKVGLDYYPRATDMYDDVKFIPVKIKYGYICYAVYDLLLELIYRDKGYYLNSEKNVVVKIAYMLQGKYSPDTDIIKDVIGMLVAERLFDADQFKQGIITSRRVQETYYIATARRKNISVDPSIWLLSLPEMKALGTNRGILSIFEKCDINEVNVDINEQREREIEREKEREREIEIENKKKERERELSSLAVNTCGTFSNVFLTDGDLDYIKSHYPASWQRKIDNLSEYMKATGKEYSDHLATIVRWAKQDDEKSRKELNGKKDNFSNFQGSSYTDEEKKKILELKKAKQKGVI